MVRYIIIGNQRSGTSAVHLALKGHPEVSALNDEVNANFFIKGISAFTNGYNNAAEEKKSQLLLFDALTSAEANETTKAKGLKIAVDNPLKAKEIVNCVIEKLPEVKIILTHRRDYTAQYASLKRAQITGKWHSWVNTTGNNVTTLNIKLPLFQQYLLNCLKVFDLLKSLQNTHEVRVFSYEEDLLNNYFDKLFHFLGLEKQEMNWFMSEKVSPAPEEFIKDYRNFKNLAEYYIEYRNELESAVEKLKKEKKPFNRILKGIFQKALL